MCENLPLDERRREKERSKEPREFRGILNPWTALQFDTISWPLSVTSMGNRRPRDITVALTPALSATPFFSLSRFASVFVLFTTVYLFVIYRRTKTQLSRCVKMSGIERTDLFACESVISKANEYFREFQVKSI